MAGPSYTGVKTVIDPFEGLQKAVSNAGDIYREYEKSSREADVHNAKMQEVERVKHQRDFLKNYDPQFGVQGRGLTDDAKRFAQEEEERIVQHFAEASARGEEVPSPEELRKQISATYGQLATQESAQQVIVKDLLAQGFEPADAAAYAQSLTGGLVSRASLQEQEKNRADAKREFHKEIREAGDKTLQRQHEGMKANAAVMDVENKMSSGYYYRNGSRTTSGSTPPSGTYQEADAFATALGNKISSWPLKVDSQAALNVIHKGLDAYNQKRLAESLPPLPRSEAYNLAYETIGTKWLIDSDISAQTPGEFEVLLEERFNNNPGAFRRGQYGGGGSWGTYRQGSTAAPAGGTASGQPSNQPPGQQYTPPPEANYIREGLIARGLPEHITAGFLMNMQDESGFKPGVNEEEPLVPGSKGGYGLYQLTGSRREDYEQFARDRGADFADIDTQLDFLVHELTGSERNAAEIIFGTKTQGEAGIAILEHFLRPAEEHRPARADRYRVFGAEGAGTNQYVAGGGGGTGSSTLAYLDQNSANMLRDVVLVQPRSMTEIEKARVQEAFKGYIPRPQAAPQRVSGTTAGGSSTTTTATPRQGAGGTPGEKGGAAVAKAAEDAIKRRDELLAKQGEVAGDTTKVDTPAPSRDPGTPTPPKDPVIPEGLYDLSFLSDPSLSLEERVARLRSNTDNDNRVRDETGANNLNRLIQERNAALEGMRNTTERLDSWDYSLPYSLERSKELLKLRQDEGALPRQIERLDDDIRQALTAQSQEEYTDPNRPIEELLPRGVYNLEAGAGVSPRAAEIARGFIQEYEDTVYDDFGEQPHYYPGHLGGPNSRLFGLLGASSRYHNAPKALMDKVNQTAERIAVSDPALAAEITRAAIFGKNQVDNRRSFIREVEGELKTLGATRDDLINQKFSEPTPEARAGLDLQIDAIRRLQEYLNVR